MYLNRLKKDVSSYVALYYVPVIKLYEKPSIRATGYESYCVSTDNHAACILQAYIFDVKNTTNCKMFGSVDGQSASHIHTEWDSGGHKG